MYEYREKFESIIRLGIEMNEIQDLDLLMHKILTGARAFARADAGSIYIKDGDLLRFSYTQNDTLQSRLLPGKKLIFSTFTLPVNNNTIAGYVAMNGEILNIPDVYKISPDVPYKFGKGFDAVSNYRTCSMLTLPMKTNRGTTIGVLQIINAMDGESEIVPFPDEDVSLMEYFANTAAGLLEKAQMTRTIILRMISMAELHDPKETGAHVNRVAGYAAELYETWAGRRDIPEEEVSKKVEVLRMAAMLHDVGKISISDLILKKPAKFTPEEFEIMKNHTVNGARLFANPKSEFDEAAAEVALNHHERWDGRGYPGHVDVMTGLPLAGYADENGKARGKRGEEIPIFGRVVAVADVYDALCSRRVYKEAWQEEEVLDLLGQEAGKQFDPELIEIFMSIHDVIVSIRERYQ